MKEETTNIVISGVGGQGVLTLAVAIAEAATAEGYDVTTAEIHGLAMRFGHLEVHVRIGKRVLSPLVPDCEANLVIGLEPIETLRASRYLDRETTVVFDTLKAIPVKMHLHKEEYPSIGEITKALKTTTKKVLPMDASKIVKKELGSTLQSNSYILGYCVGAKLIRLKQSSVMKVLDLLPAANKNKEAFKLGNKAGSR